MSYEDTTGFLRDHASRSLAQAITSREAVVLQRETPPDLNPTAFDYTVETPDRGAIPTLSELLNTAEADANGGQIDPPNAEWLDEQAAQWMSTYFPNVTSEFKNIPEEWLTSVLTGSAEFGVPTSVFDSIWRRARDRAEIVRQSEFRNIEAGFAARGFTMPTGAMITALDEANQRASQTPLEINVEQALKDAEIKADFVRLAAQLATSFRVNILQAMATFHGDWTRLLDRDRDLDRLQARASVISTFYQAIGRYYDVDVAFEQIKLNAEQARVQAKTVDDRSKIDLYGLRERSADALGQAVRGFADISAAAANAASSLTAEIESI